MTPSTIAMRGLFPAYPCSDQTSVRGMSRWPSIEAAAMDRRDEARIGPDPGGGGGGGEVLPGKDSPLEKKY